MTRPARLTSEAGACAIGLDVGGTKIAAGLVNLATGHILARRIIPTAPQRGGKAVLADTLALVEGLSTEAAALGREIVGIGVGIAELVDRSGQITSAHTLDWRDLPVQAPLSELAPTIIESDVRAAALAEVLFGAGRGIDYVIYVTVGTGISCCLVQHGRPYRGARGHALILANSPLTTRCSACGTVLNPVLEEIASGPALVRHYNQHSRRQLTRGEEVMQAVDAGDAVAIEVISTAGEALGTSVGFLINVLDPEVVIVGGGLGLAGGLYWDSFITSTRRHIWSATTRDLAILPAALGADTGLIGAAALWRQAAES